MTGDHLVRSIGALLVIAPHPDDEVLGCGWLMRAVCQRGGRVVIAWLTDGGGSHGTAVDRAALIATRRAEAASGLAALGIIPAACYWLCARDGFLADFATPAANVDWLQDICDAHAIDTVAVTARDDGHPDHRAAFALASGLRGLRRYAYPVSARYDGVEAAGGVVALTIGPHDDGAKRRALGCHASQSAAGGALYPMSAAAVERFCTQPERFYPIGLAA